MTQQQKHNEPANQKETKKKRVLSQREATARENESERERAAHAQNRPADWAALRAALSLARLPALTNDNEKTKNNNNENNALVFMNEVFWRGI